MFVLVAWLAWRQRAVFHESLVDTLPWLGVASFILGLLCYIVGRSQFFYQLEVGSQIPLLLGIVCLLLGKTGLRQLWFPILLLTFVIPIPGSILDQLLLPLKAWVSSVVDGVLHMAGYPIARNGVVLAIGPYSLLIADACSGLNSMLALSGIGLLYVYVAGRSSRWLNIVLISSILPIAFLANVVRVMMLVLITFYSGEGAGAAFHDFAAYLEVGFALGGFFILDRALGWVQDRKPIQKPTLPKSSAVL